jgi:nitrous-oxide reductase
VDDPKKYAAVHTCIDAKTMKVRWQAIVDGNLDLCATDYKGKYSMACCYNSEGGTNLGEMIAADRDWLTVFNLERIEAAVKAGKTTRIGDSPVPVVDGRGKNDLVLYIPIPKSPHGVNVDPTGRYAMCAGKLSPTVSVVDLEKVDQAFAGKIKPRDCVVAEPEVGLGPLHTAFDNKGNAYTSIFIDSVVTKWNIAKAVAGENPVVQKIDVHYQPGHINASMSETKEADGKWVISLNKFSKDRFLPVGPYRNENEQLIDISGAAMRMEHETPTHPEPHDAVIVRRDIIRPKKVWDRDDPRFDFERKIAAKFGIKLEEAAHVFREGKHAYVLMSGVAPAFSLPTFTVKSGETVTVVLTNNDRVEDLSHGFCLSHHDVNFGVSPQETASATFTAGKPGVYWFYCPWFCHALHLEMRGRMIVT